MPTNKHSPATSPVGRTHYSEETARNPSSPSSQENLSEKQHKPDPADPNPQTEDGFFKNETGQDEESRGMDRQLSLASAPSHQQPKYTEDGKRIITEEECKGLLGYDWPAWKKWMLFSSIFIVQVSMNFNTSVFPNAVVPISEEFGVSEPKARVAQAVYLILYAFGCELWAPWSEEFGRWTILQASIFLVNIWQVLAGLAPNFGSIIVARALGGLSCAGGSVTLGMVADLYGPDDQQWAVAFVVLSSVGGTSIGPVVGGPIQKYLPWNWNFWIQLIFGGVAQAIHFFMPESRSTIIMDREAKRRRKTGEDPNVYGPNEVKKPRISMREFGVTWIRPFEMFLREPIVLCCSLLSGFSDALIFTFQEGFHPVYEQWGFGTLQIAWAFIPINIGYLVAYASYVPWIIKHQRLVKVKGSDSIPPEFRLKWLLWLAPLETIGLFGFAWTSMGPPESHWIGPMIFSFLIAIANFAIYMSTVDYMIAAYGVYSASATGGNGFARDFLAGVAAMYSTPLYTNIPPKERSLEYASTILACLAFAVTMPVYLIYWKGPAIRHKSKFAQSLDAERKARGQSRLIAASSEALEPENL